MPLYTENEQKVVRYNPLFLLLRRVIVRPAHYGKSWKPSNKRKIAPSNFWLIVSV